jgi:2-polyprenyl-3-methyl-5-hydroxy-6-metoxy-1,4-benzoquinol methylase
MNGILSPLMRSWRFSLVKEYIKGDVLDYGCGVGHLPHYIKDISSYLGVDVNDDELIVATKNNSTGVFIRPEQLKNTEQFDTIVSLAVIEYISDLSDFFSKLKQHLRHDGVIIITSPHPASKNVRNTLIKLNLLGSTDNDHRLWLPRKEELIDTAEKSGLKLIKFNSFMFGLNQVWLFKLDSKQSYKNNIT